MTSLLQEIETFLEKLHDRAGSAAERLTIDCMLNKVRDKLAEVGG